MLRSRAHVQRGRSGRQTKSGASGRELLVASKHVPDRVGEPTGDVDLGDLGATKKAIANTVRVRAAALAAPVTTDAIEPALHD